MRQAIVLAGGLGTRLRGVISDAPKVMAPVEGRPFLEIVLRALAARCFDEVVLSVGYMAEAVVDHFGDAWAGLRLRYEIEREPLGTGGAIARSLQRCTADHVHVLNGDTFLDLDVEAVERRWSERRRPIIVGRVVEETSRYGSLVVDGDRVVGFLEKSATSGSGLINAGWYVLPPDVCGAERVGKRFSFETEFLPGAIGDRAFDVFVTDALFLDIGVPDDYRRAQTLLAGR